MTHSKKFDFSNIIIFGATSSLIFSQKNVQFEKTDILGVIKSAFSQLWKRFPRLPRELQVELRHQLIVRDLKWFKARFQAYC